MSPSNERVQSLLRCYGARDANGPALAAALAELLVWRRSWTPLTERLPPHDGWYEVCGDAFWLPDAYVLEYRGAEAPCGGYWMMDGRFNGIIRAWRELPPRYVPPQEQR